jgi:hypothetical protein
MAIYRRASDGTSSISYVLSDHQGSIDAIASGAGTSLITQSFTPFGVRRDASRWSGPPSAADRSTMDGVTRQGYTFQTVLGSMGLNHMNGRVLSGSPGATWSHPTVRGEQAGSSSNTDR